MDDTVDERLDAIERALTDGEAPDGLPDAAHVDARLDDIEAAAADLDDRLAELEAAVDALRGFAGGIKAVDEAVERRANAAVARVERLEAELREADRSGIGTGRAPARSTAGCDTSDAIGESDDPTGRGFRSSDATRTGLDGRAGAPDPSAPDADERRGYAESPAGFADRSETSLAETAAEAARRGMEREGVDARDGVAATDGRSRTANGADITDEADATDDETTLAERLRRLL
jgi:hypothetical protein